MTDEQIVKALECCTNEGVADCQNCPYEHFCGIRDNRMLNDARSLITRQKAENEELKQSLNIRFENFESEYDSKIKSEARREFADRLEEKVSQNLEIPNGAFEEVLEDINNLLKELDGAEG